MKRLTDDQLRYLTEKISDLHGKKPSPLTEDLFSALVELADLRLQIAAKEGS